MKILWTENVDDQAFMAIVSKVLTDLGRDVPGQIQQRLGLITGRKQQVVGHDGNPGAGHVVPDLDRARLLVNRNDLLLGQSQQLHQDRGAARERLGADRTMLRHDLFYLTPLAILPELDIAGELAEIRQEVFFARGDLARGYPALRALRAAAQRHPDISAIAGGKRDINDVEAERSGDEIERMIRIGPGMLVIERIELVPVEHRAEIVVLDHDRRLRSKQGFE